jgi:hypothetical protein
VPHHCVPRTPLKPAELEAIRLMYAGDKLTNIVIGARFGKRPNWVNWLAAKHGWPKRGKSWKPGRPHDGGSPSPPKERRATIDGRKIRRPRPKARTQTQVMLDNRADLEGRERRLYGALIDDANYLRGRGFVVFRQGDGFMVGNRRCTGAELHAMAERERRLEKPAPLPVASTGRRAVLPSSAGVPLKPREDPPPKLPAGICEKCGGPRSVVSTRLCRACFVGKPMVAATSTTGAPLCSCGRPKGDARSPRCRACYLAIKARAAL